ncbi:Probable sodium/metabolite cotransporter BASS4 [Durusdinium trenchii]|uniref:Chloroplastic (Bile acid-sodium symporter family protein 4) n=1 Tax=Durusdinium trenchii TaxID=1381693 RepID=A0ABP0M461_9DINO
MLVSVVLLGFVWSTPGAKADAVDLGGICFNDDICVYSTISSLCVSVIFLISGLKLKTAEMKNAVSAWKASVYGIVAILFITPCVTFVIAFFDFQGVPEFALGLVCFFSVPTTLSSGPIIVGQAKGNVPLALLLTVVSNVIGTFTSVLFLSGAFDIYVRENLDSGTGEVDISLDVVPLIVKLIFQIIVPLFIGKLLRDSFQAVQDFAKKWSVQLKLLSSALLAVVPWMKVSASRDDFDGLSAGAFFLMWFVGILVHLLYLALNYGVSKGVLHLALPEMVAVVIVASQKTLPIAITLLSILEESLPNGTVNAGIASIPIIVSHLSQIIIDSFVAAKYATLIERAGLDNDGNRSTDNCAAKECAFRQTGVGPAFGSKPESKRGCVGLCRVANCLTCCVAALCRKREEVTTKMTMYEQVKDSAERNKVAFGALSVLSLLYLLATETFLKEDQEESDFQCTVISILFWTGIVVAVVAFVAGCMEDKNGVTVLNSSEWFRGRKQAIAKEAKVYAAAEATKAQDERMNCFQLIVGILRGLRNALLVVMVVNATTAGWNSRIPCAEDTSGNGTRVVDSEAVETFTFVSLFIGLAAIVFAIAQTCVEECRSKRGGGGGPSDEETQGGNGEDEATGKEEASLNVS